MMRNLIVLMMIGLGLTAGAAQSKTSSPQYLAGNGRCGVVYMLENTPPFFDQPKTTRQMEYVIRVLRSAPPQADVKCSDMTDAWAPYLYADRKIAIAQLLIKLKKYEQAREELWSLFLDRPVVYGKRKLYYNFGTNDAVALLFGKALWNMSDISRRLKSRKYRNTSEIEKAYRNTLPYNQAK